uniref:Uncharacterized protein n=1 Tax=Ciona savignyi TaxID=51511 RepID=H2Y6U2_CIOSA
MNYDDKVKRMDLKGNCSFKVAFRTTFLHIYIGSFGCLHFNIK